VHFVILGTRSFRHSVVHVACLYAWIWSSVLNILPFLFEENFRKSVEKI